jgi:hypothetical protein
MLLMILYPPALRRIVAGAFLSLSGIVIGDAGDLEAEPTLRLRQVIWLTAAHTNAVWQFRVPVNANARRVGLLRRAALRESAMTRENRTAEHGPHREKFQACENLLFETTPKPSRNSDQRRRSHKRPRRC